MIEAGQKCFQMKVRTFQFETRSFYEKSDGLPVDGVHSIALDDQGRLYAATTKGLVTLREKHISPVEKLKGASCLVVGRGPHVMALGNGGLYRLDKKEASLLAQLPEEIASDSNSTILLLGEKILVGTAAGLYVHENGSFAKDTSLSELLGGDPNVRQIAFSQEGECVVAAQEGLFSKDGDSSWQRLLPRDGGRSWAPYDVRGVGFDDRGRLWFASPQGVGVREEDRWTLLTGEEGLPFDDFTTLACGPNGICWLGTSKGAIRTDGKTWAYRQGPRWLPDDHVRAIQVEKNGSAWIATSQGLSRIAMNDQTLAHKASFFEDEIDRYHRRTPWGYVYSVRLERPGDKSAFTQRDSDNDGLWTSMYGAGECFAYAATRSPEAKKRAKAAFEAMNFLREVTQGGSHPAPPGFVARCILPTSGKDPNEGRIEGDREKHQHGDKLWKVFEPRWPVSEDGKWYWKTDTSSDELDGHFFLYGLYYDLVAETEEEKKAVQLHVGALSDHLLEHDFQLVDHDGQPTRWGRFSPKEMNFAKDWWEARGLNSMSILSYLATADHICGGDKYREAVDDLVNRHGYGINLMYPKHQYGMGSGNQSDDEMAFMDYYNLIKYTHDEELRQLACLSLHHYWGYIQPALNPFFNMIHAVCCTGSVFKDTWGERDLSPKDDAWLEESVDTLQRIPLDRVSWPLENSHRKDLLPLPDYVMEGRSRPRGYRKNGKVLSIDERVVEHWNHDPWELDYKQNGLTLCDGTIFLLPYYMGLYYGFIQEETR